MTEAPAFLTVDQVLSIHRRMIQEFGGDPAVRDQGLLESAVRMPAARFGRKFLHEGLPAMAAAYFFHICRNHAFVDGNKRAALAAAEVFLDLNDLRLAASNRQVEDLTLRVAAAQASKEEVVAFFQRHTRRSTGRSRSR